MRVQTCMQRKLRTALQLPSLLRMWGTDAEVNSIQGRSLDRGDACASTAGLLEVSTIAAHQNRSLSPCLAKLRFITRLLPNSCL